MPRELLWEESMKQFALQYYSTGRSATVAVMDNPEGVRSLLINGKTDASAHDYAAVSDLRTQKMLTHLAMLMAPRQEEVFVVGLGSGITAGAVLEHAVNNLRVAEISPAVIEAAGYFERFNNGVLQSQKASIFPMDARQHLRIARPSSYDVIISQPSNPWIKGESMLFTSDWYEIVKSRLRPQGLFAQWIPAYNISPGNLKVIIHTLSRVFPNLTIWTTGSEGDLILLASRDDRFRIDYPQVMARSQSAALQAELARLKLDPERFFFDQFVMGPQEIGKYLKRGIRYPLRANTDDLLITEHRMPKDMLARNTVDFFLELRKDEFSSDSLLRVTKGLQREQIEQYRRWVKGAVSH
jgi:spermidine synthase